MASKMYVDTDLFEISISHLRNGPLNNTPLTKHSIVIGGVNGQFRDCFGKVAKLHTKNNFAFAILVGDAFADASLTSDAQEQELADLLSGKIDVPIPTYFALGKKPFPAAVIDKLTSNQGEVCPNLVALGRKVSIKTSEGFKIVAIGGNHASSDDESMDEYSAAYSEKDTQSLCNVKDCDILITSDWPADVRDGSKVTYPGEAPAGVKSISDLCATLKPKYHFSTSEHFYQREPFFHSGPPPQARTFFISMADLNNPHKQKAIFAFSLEPNAPPPQSLENCTASPFFKKSISPKRKASALEDGNQNGFRFANGNSYHDRPSRKPKRQRYQPTTQECVFCLSRSNVESHMITSITDDAYMTIAKGPLTTRTTFQGFNVPLHMLIIPVRHAPTFAAVPDEEREKTHTLMEKYRQAFHNMITVKSTNGADDEAQLGAVTWEISKASGVHLHWQILPVPVDLVKKKIIEAAFDVEAENSHYPKFAKDTSEIQKLEDGDYLKVWIWSESTQKEIVLPIGQIDRFDLQFPRRVLAKLLKLESRIQWRNVQQTAAEEEADADAFRELFKDYDFSLEGVGE